MSFLLKAVNISQAHIAAWRQIQAKFEDAPSLFMDATPEEAFSEMQRSSSETFADHFMRITSDKRQKMKENAASSGRLESKGEKEILVDDVLQEIDEKVEREREEKEKRTAQENRLLAAWQLFPTARFGACLKTQGTPRLWLQKLQTTKLWAKITRHESRIAPGSRRRDAALRTLTPTRGIAN
ncbi:unnamed protein product [Agarophyton chilense]